MANFLSLQMTPPVYPVSGPTGDGRSLQNARGEFNFGTQSVGALAAGDTIVMMRVHRNFRVVSGFVKFDALGAGVTVQVGDSGNNARYFAASSAASAGSSPASVFAFRSFCSICSSESTSAMREAGEGSDFDILAVPSRKDMIRGAAGEM